MKRNMGFTLLEAVIVTIILGVAMVTFSSLLAPQFADSGDYHYFTRTSALGQSIMTEMLSVDTDLITLVSAADNIINNLDPSYNNYQLAIDVQAVSGANNLDQITLNITASNQTPVTFTAFKGEYE